jgi:hypothetical protein
MNDALKAFLPRWAKALRSPKYAHGRNRLRDHTHYCCLGVACAIDRHTRHLGDGYYENGGSREDYLPPGLAARLGITVSPRITAVTTTGYDFLNAHNIPSNTGLSNINDDPNRPSHTIFPLIADILDLVAAGDLELS